MKRIRIPFLIIACSLIVTTSFLGLSAYLTDTDTYTQYLTTAAGDELGFSLSGDEIENASILPGQTLNLNVRANVNNGIPLYLFIKMDIPSDFELVKFYESGWRPIEDGSNIYYYGTASSLLALGDKESGTSTPILGGVKLSTSVTGNNSYELTITGYAIQAEGISTSASPSDVFSDIGASQNGGE